MQAKTKSILQSAAWAVLPVAAIALLSSFFTRTGDIWYQTLIRPSFSPAQWVFPVAWGIVYVCLMLSVFLLLRTHLLDLSLHLGLFVSIGVLNVLWSLVFFGLHAMLPAALILALLLAVLVYLFFSLLPVCSAAAWLLLPHILWGLYAFALNIGFFFLNRL